MWFKVVDHTYVVEIGFEFLTKCPACIFHQNVKKTHTTFHNRVCFLREGLTLVSVCFVGLSSITCVCFVMEELTPVLVHFVYPPIACVCFVRGELTPVLKNLKQNNV